MARKPYLPAEGNRCYIGILPDGNICTAMILRPDNTEDTAATVASWILQGLIVSVADVEVVRSSFVMSGVKLEERSFAVAVYTDNDGELAHAVEDDGGAFLYLLEDEHGICLNPKH